MEKRPPLPQTPFDALTTSTELQMLKLILPYLPPSVQGFLAFYIKFLELQKTLQYFGIFHSSVRQRDTFSKSWDSPLSILEDLKPYLGENQETVDTLLSAMSMMDMMKGMEMPDMSDLDMGNLSGMMDLFNQGSESKNNDNKKGNDEHGFRMDESSRNETYGSGETGTHQDSGSPDPGEEGE